MIDINLIRDNKELVKENIKKKFQDNKLILVDKVYDLDKEYRNVKQEVEELRYKKNQLSDSIGILVKNNKSEEISVVKDNVSQLNKKIELLSIKEEELIKQIQEIMYKIPNIIDSSVPLGKNDSENVEIKKYGEIKSRNYEIPYHADIMECLDGLDKDSAGFTSGNGFYYLLGDVARLHSALINYARDFMIDRGFTYVLPPFMIRSDVVSGVMSFEEMNDMMYKIDGEDLFLIGTSEHSLIGKFKNTILKEETLPITYTSYSPCFRKEVGAHGIEERGIYRVHQFEKEEMIVVCKPEESGLWYNKMKNYTIEFFESLNVPVRELECCSGDLADLKAKSCDIEAWSPRQEKYFEVGSCSNLTSAQSRRLGFRISTSKEKYFPHTLNNTVVATPRGLIAVVENNYNEDGSITIPEVLRKYMGGLERIIKH